MKLDLTDMQSDILTLAAYRDEPTNAEIASILGCSESYVGEIRREHEAALDEKSVAPALVTIDADAREVEPGPSVSGAVTGSGSGSDDEWYGLVGLVTFGQVAGLALAVEPEAVPILPAAAAAGVFGLCLLAAPVVIFIDAARQHATGASYRPNRLLWPIGAFMAPVIIPAWYTLKRG